MTTSAQTTGRSAPGTPARLYAGALARDLPPLAVLAAFVAEPSTRDFALVNLGVQLTLFVLGGCIPAYRTRVIAIVDAVWSWGLAAIGALALAFGDLGSPVLVVVACAYIAMGARLGTWAILFFAREFPHDDLPRYHYRRLEWRREGYASETFPMLHEILQQALSNVSLLAAPAMIAVAAADGGLGPAAVAGAVVWALSWALEALADRQKSVFVRRAEAAGETRTCDAGLWRFSRHPNYFFQWMQWNGLVLLALPSLVGLAGDLSPLVFAGFAVGLALVPGGMYFVLVHFTGAIPAEHFSVQHRPDYRDYQERVNRFFPGPSRRPAPGARPPAG